METENVSTKKTVVVLLSGMALGVLLAVAIAYVCRGSFVHGLVAIWLGALVGIPAALVGTLVLSVSALRRRQVGRRIGTAASVTAEIFLLLLASWPLGVAIQQQDVRTAKEYCERVAELLEAYRDRVGEYPLTVDAVVEEAGAVPLLLRGSGHRELVADFYDANGELFVLRFEVEDGLLPTVHCYYSSTGNWEEFS